MAAESIYFETILVADRKRNEIILADIDGEQLRNIVSFLYTGRIAMTDQSAMEYAVIAFQLKLNLLHEKCANYFVENLSNAKSFECQLFAGKLNMSELRQKAFKLIIKEIEEMLAWKMQKLDFEAFKKCLQSDWKAETGETIFARLVDWIEFDGLARSKYASELLQCIRFKNISAKVKLIQFNFNYDPRFN